MSSSINLQQVFKYLGSTNSGSISKADLPKAIRYLGIIKTQNDFNYLLKDLPEQISYEQFEKIINDEKANSISKEQLLQAFQIFDENKTGKCSAKELFHALSVIGEKLNENDIEKIKKISEVDGEGKIDYTKIVDILISS